MKQETINQIRYLREQGKKYNEISKIVGYSIGTIQYWLNEDYKKDKIRKQVERFRNMPLEKRKEVYKKRLPYIRSYLKKKYKEDENYRNKERERSRKK